MNIPKCFRNCFSLGASTLGINTSTQSTANPQINQTQVDSVTTGSRSEQDPPVEGAQVSSHTKVRSDATDASPPLSTQSNKNPVTILYVIFNLSSDAHIYIPKGTIVEHPDGSEPDVDVIEVAETIKEAQETMQYRNHLPSRP